MKQSSLFIFVAALFSISNCGGLSEHSAAPAASQLGPQLSQTRLHVEIEPSANSGFVRQHHFNIMLGDLFSNGIELKPTVKFNGRLVKTKSSGLAATSTIQIETPNMNSEVIAIPVDSVPLSSTPLSAPVDSQGTFSINLVAGQPFRLIANPQGLFSLPPVFFDVKLESDFEGDLPLPSSGRRVFGLINQNSSLSNEQLEDKLWIRVVQGKRQISSLGRISADGRFSVLLANTLFERDTRRFPVELVIEPSADTTFLPTKRIKLALRNDNSDVQVGTIDLGPNQPLVRPRFLIRGPDNAPISDARVFVRALVRDGFIQSSASSDEKGNAEIIVPHGFYDIAVIPKQDETVGFRKLRNVELRSSDAFEIQLERRSVLDSSIHDELGSPVKGAHMVLTRFARSDANTKEAIVEATEMRLEATSDQMGKWCILGLSILSEGCRAIHLDSGRYKVSITPPEGSRYPYFTQVFDFPERAHLPIVLKRALPLTGKIFGPKSREPVANAFVRIYSSELLKDSNAPIFLTQGFSRADGSFSVDLAQDYVLGKTP